MKELFFHIGTPKTGSSALQVFLARNATKLREKSVDYLAIGEIGLGQEGKISSGNGAFVARSLFPTGASAAMKDPERYLAEFEAAAAQSPAETIIVSSEMFVDADKTALSALCSRLRDKDITPRAIYFIRSQVQFLTSAYMQQVKRHGCTEDPVQYITRTYKHIPFLKHQTFYENVREVFGAGNVLCRTYEGATTTKVGLFTTFLTALSIDATALDMNINDINTSMAPKEIAIMRLLNQFQPRMKFSDMVVENAAHIGSASSGQLHNMLPEGLVAEITDYFSKENASFAQTYFHRAELFPPLPQLGAPESTSVDDLTISDLVLFFGGLLVRYDQRLAAIEGRSAA